MGRSSLSWHFLQVFLRGDTFELFCLPADRLGDMRLLRIVSRDDVDLVVAHVLVGLNCPGCSLLCLLTAKLVRYDLIASAHRPYVPVAARALSVVSAHLFRSCPLDFLLLR